MPSGSDTLIGGTGVDVFVFDAALDETGNVDLVVDLASGADKLQLDDAIFTSLTAGVALTTAEFLSGASATEALTAAQRIIYDTSTGALYYDADGAGGVAAVQFAVLGSSSHPALGVGDFVVG